jgi:two-component system CitB family sensor kinase/two-component system sensor histidine kinase DcuS
VAEVLPEAGMEKVLDSGVQRLDEELALGGHQMIFNLIPLRNNDQVNGVVASFRRKDEIDVLARELSSVRQYADMLRAQAHEHSNQLHTIAGLIQLESYDEALELIVSQEASFQEFVGLLTRIAPDPILSALIIGKFNHAQENDVELVLDPDSDRLDPPAEFDRNRLVTILGNLLDNACEAARTVESRPHRVRLQLGQTADELCFAVDDSGPGIPDDLAGRIFDKGISGKNGANRGVGLFLVQRALKKLGGRIEVETSELGGARFSVQIPKQTRR